MKHIQIAAAALVLAVTGASMPAAADPGRNLAAACANCHGTDGRSLGSVPSLAGQPREAIARAMREFRDGKRTATIMHQISKGYTDAQIDTLAAYFAARPAQAGR